MNTQTGLVGFFDILGYQNLLEKNEPEDIAQSVMPTLTKIDASVKMEVTELVKGLVKSDPNEHKKVDDLIHNIKWLIFSDTILLVMPLEQPDSDSNLLPWATFILTCIQLQGSMWFSGLPLRGAISYGKFFVQDACFAGRSIIEAYQLCNKLDLAACVFSPTAGEHLLLQDKHYRDTSGKNTAFSNLFFFNYLVPFVKEESHSLVLAAHTYKTEDSDIKKQVLSSFWGHNKDVPISVQRKVINTEQWLRFLKSKRT